MLRYLIMVMVAIFFLPLNLISESVRISSAVLVDLENVGVAFGFSLLSCSEAENLRYFIYFSDNGDQLHFTSYWMSESVHISSAVLEDPYILV